MNRTARLRFLATKRGMKVAAHVQQLRRGGLDHRYVVGQFFLIRGQVVLHCVRMNPAYDVPRPPVFTDQAALFYRWRTRQAAHQFAQRWKIPEFHVIDMGYLDVLAAAALTGSKRDVAFTGSKRGLSRGVDSVSTPQVPSALAS